MQVHFDLRDVLIVTSVSIRSERVEGDPDFGRAHSGTCDYKGKQVRFSIETNTKNGISDGCWAGIASDRTILDFLVDNRIPFNAP